MSEKAKDYPPYLDYPKPRKKQTNGDRIRAMNGRIVDAAEILEKANNSPWFDGDVAELGLLLGSEVTTIIPAERRD